MKHKNIVGIGLVSLTTKRLNKNSQLALKEIMNEINSSLETAGFFKSAPFDWINLIIRLGCKNDARPMIGKISRKYGDLAVSIEIDVLTEQISDYFVFRSMLFNATLLSVVEVGQKYDLPISDIKHLTL